MQHPSVTISSDFVSICMPDGTSGTMPVSQWSRLAAASSEQLADFYLCDEGIHWPQLNEDISYDCILRGGENRSGLYALFMHLNWIKVSAIARQLGISQSLMAQYVSGTKKPSAERLAQIEACLHSFASELAAVKLTC